MLRVKLKSAEINFAPYQHDRYEMLKPFKRNTFYVNNGSRFLAHAGFQAPPCGIFDG